MSRSQARVIDGDRFFRRGAPGFSSGYDRYVWSMQRGSLISISWILGAAEKLIDLFSSSLQSIDQCVHQLVLQDYLHIFPSSPSYCRKCSLSCKRSRASLPHFQYVNTNTNEKRITQTSQRQNSLHPTFPVFYIAIRSLAK